jgi:hypothetical protein
MSEVIAIILSRRPQANCPDEWSNKFAEIFAVNIRAYPADRRANTTSSIKELVYQSRVFWN